MERLSDEVSKAACSMGQVYRIEVEGVVEAGKAMRALVITFMEMLSVDLVEQMAEEGWGPGGGCAVRWGTEPLGAPARVASPRCRSRTQTQ